MSGYRLTQFRYAHQKQVEFFGDQIFLLEEYHLTDISRGIKLDTVYNSIGYMVNRYLSTGLLPFEEFSEEPLFPGEA